MYIYTSQEFCSRLILALKTMFSNAVEALFKVRLDMDTPIYCYNTVKLLSECLRRIKSSVADEQDIQRWVELMDVALETLDVIILDLESEIKSSGPIDFRPLDHIAPILGFAPRILEAGQTHSLDHLANIFKVNALCVECNITCGAHLNGQRIHSIHEFGIKVSPGYRIAGTPSFIAYLPVGTESINHLQVRMVDQDGNIVNFRGEIVTVRLNLRTGE
ncbi:hypothetical protein QAD02_012712 [Eretmocerus hayati]|uniref:Uncharacterized protein n=1 Tax=Eretmocerus hayati TaxID=131215 RepID=A0ACC2P0H2_9HYME|nr:hypothetical protein QAD02_012712 [Eretmocerus hayati]